MEKCFILKYLIMKLAKQGRIHLNLDKVVESNHVIVTFGSLDPTPLHNPPKTLGACAGTIQCELPMSKQTQVSTRTPFFIFTLIMNQCHIAKKVGHW